VLREKACSEGAAPPIGSRHETGRTCEQMTTSHIPASAKFPSLIDDPEFLAELGKLESESSPSPSTRPAAKRRRAPAGPMEPGIRRDINRWHLHSDAPDTASTSIVGGSASTVPAFLIILIGLCAGAACSVIVFHERVALIVDLFAR
jgi:hypothetical protein